MSNQTIAYPIEERLYLSITDRCTLVCEFCPKTQGTMQVHEFDLTIDHRPEYEEIIAAIGDPSAYQEVVFCGFGEPTLRLKLLLQVAQWIKQRGGMTRINTDGLANLVHKRNVVPEMVGLIDTLSVSMNGQNEAVYNQHCQPQLEGAFSAMVEFLKAASGVIPSVTATAIEGLEGVDIDACKAQADACGVAFRKRSLDIVG
ncbi:MAG TPA: 4Fe-4S cluster-binding domain-containing protein [Gammaproteobacteria bacterium]|nr:4Fe-4S cluster-binding domain-containing protein [Gammaproteobacteria bacterium]MBT3717678.1 4Fe-4S cluster-binding domain-containing protein [Gammaproteobacteria bacterium]MBT3845652.1 4Fe-4S cluster-binding domain-containing protein [Gammaproteobacteria bacterium]MBT4299774.1 4Fe-4S cluster-binding domain-containing protein [Gammaproteobacteria bacterium]MBT4548304.1 4Fe-4S cluster-binding domain-containing protein [Gammaproteobacteria bacterium]